MTNRENEEIEIPERTHDQPAEGGREQADQAAGTMNQESPDDKVE